MLPTKSKCWLALAATTLLVTACGGGGSGGGGGGNNNPDPAPPPPTTTPPPSTEPGFSISGTVVATSSQAVDSDTNDPASPGIPNNTLSSAQALGNPITLGGYVNQPGSGASGRSLTTGDIDDFYRVELLAGQRITMLVADFQQADADLYLYDTDGNIVDFSIESGEVESIIVPQDGTYLVNAFAFAGATNYILAIGTGETVLPAAGTHFDIVPWEAVVKYDDSQRANDINSAMGMSRRAGAMDRPQLMGINGELEEPDLELSRFGNALVKRSLVKDPSLRIRLETLLTIKHVKRQPGVLSAEPNYRVRSFLLPNDEAIDFQWHYPLIGLPAAWDTTTGDPGITVAVIDTGILSGHPDLRNQLVPGYDFIRDTINAADGDGIDPNPEDRGNPSAPGSSSYHGTHVAGTIAATGNNGIGVSGVAWDARIMPLRVLGIDGAGTSYDVDQAIRFAAGLENDSGQLPAAPADIINLSLGGAPFSQSTQDLIDRVREEGISVVAAAGNEATSSPAYPASYNNVISVSAVDIQARLAPYSNRGSRIDVAAPGGNNGVDINGDGYPDGVLSTGGSSSAQNVFAYTFLSGTSMASPHVAGVLALMKSVNPELTAEDIDVLLETGELTDDQGAPGRDDSFGYGLIRADRAVLAALEARGESPADNPRLTASANTLSFGISDQPLRLDFDNGGKGELALVSVEASEPWLLITPVEVDTSGLGTYDISIQREALDAGLYSATITANSSVNTVQVRVFMSIGDQASNADVGVVYALLYDPLTDTVLGEAQMTSDQGEYRFNFADIPAGTYQIVAGSDSDNDLFICDPGEACGAWLTLDQPLDITLDGDKEGLDFPVEYQIFIPDISSSSEADNTAESPRAGKRPPVRRPGLQ